MSRAPGFEGAAPQALAKAPFKASEEKGASRTNRYKFGEL